MKLSLPPKLVKKLVWVPVISFSKIFIPSYAFDALLCRNWLFSPPKLVTLWITLVSPSRALKNFVSEGPLYHRRKQWNSVSLFGLLTLPRGETFCISAGFGTTIALGWGRSQNKGFSMSVRSGTGSYLHLGAPKIRGLRWGSRTRRDLHYALLLRSRRDEGKKEGKKGNSWSWHWNPMAGACGNHEKPWDPFWPQKLLINDGSSSSSERSSADEIVVSKSTRNYGSR
jgi:hypothetical protein